VCGGSALPTADLLTALGSANCNPIPACDAAAQCHASELPVPPHGRWHVSDDCQTASLVCDDGFEQSHDAPPPPPPPINPFGPLPPAPVTPPPPVVGSSCFGQPPAVLHGTWSVLEGANGLAVATLACNPTYSLSGSPTVACANGAWAASPFAPSSCVAIGVTPPPPPPVAALCDYYQNPFGSSSPVYSWVVPECCRACRAK
jgi:hypothetical protein